MLYNDVNDLRQAFPAATPMPIQTATMPGPTGQVPMAGLTTPPAGSGPGVRGPPIGQAIPMMPPPPVQKSGGMLDSLKQHKILVIGAVLALLLIIGIVFLLLRKKKGRRKK